MALRAIALRPILLNDRSAVQNSHVERSLTVQYVVRRTAVLRSTPGDATSAETGLVLMRWRGAGDVAASQGLADGQAIAAKHRQGDAARHLASERCMGRDGDENKNYRLRGRVCMAGAARARRAPAPHAA